MLEGIFGGRLKGVSVDSDGAVLIRIKASDIAVPTDEQYSAVKVTAVDHFRDRPIRSTSSIWGGASLDWSTWQRQVWRVDNTHDQPVNIFLNLTDVGDYTNASGNLLKITVPANKERMIITPADFPILGEALAESVTLGCTCAVAPTTGTITVVAYVR